jgi:hypothetical protein
MGPVCQFVANQRLLQYGDEWAIPRQEDGACLSGVTPPGATFSPTSVFPAPGTPVRKTMAFSRLARDRSMISSTATDVTFRFFAPASCRDIESTVCLKYSARGFNDRWCRLVGSSSPRLTVDWLAVDRPQSVPDDDTQVGRSAAARRGCWARHRRENTTVVVNLAGTDANRDLEDPQRSFKGIATGGFASFGQRVSSVSHRRSVSLPIRQPR